MSSLIGILLFALVFPGLWGVLVHSIISRAWPVESQRPRTWFEHPHTFADEFPDYQI
jgi:hypothetical protein